MTRPQGEPRKYHHFVAFLANMSNITCEMRLVVMLSGLSIFNELTGQDTRHDHAWRHNTAQPTPDHQPISLIRAALVQRMPDLVFLANAADS